MAEKSRSDRDSQYFGPTMLAAPLAALATSSPVVVAAWPEVLREARILPAQIVDLDGRVPLRNGLAAFESAPRYTDNPLLSIEFARAFEVGGTGFLGFAMISAATVRDALKTLTRFVPLIVTTRTCRFAEEEGVARISWTYSVPAATPRLQFSCWGTETVSERLRMALGRDWRPRLIVFDTQGPAHASRLESAVGVPLRFGASENGLVIDRECLDAPMPSANRNLFAAMMKLGEIERERIGAHGSELEERLRAAIIGAMAAGDVTIARIASDMNLPASTLRTAMRRESIDFREVLNDVRMRSARELLRQPRMSITAIAFALGFSDASVFTRSCVRWFGKTPREMRGSASSV
jgi:AraC-like DNA-binding protein